MKNSSSINTTAATGEGNSDLEKCLKWFKKSGSPNGWQCLSNKINTVLGKSPKVVVKQLQDRGYIPASTKSPFTWMGRVPNNPTDQLMGRDTVATDVDRYLKWVETNGAPTGWVSLNNTLQTVLRKLPAHAVNQLRQMGYIPASRSMPFTWKVPPLHVSASPQSQPDTRTTHAAPKGSMYTGFQYIATVEELVVMLTQVPSMIAIDCEGVPERLSLVQIAFPDGQIFICDGIAIGEEVLAVKLCELLENPSVAKLIHDLHQDVRAFAQFLPEGKKLQVQQILDTQLIAEYLSPSNNPFIGMNQMLELFGLEQHPSKTVVKNKMRQEENIWLNRPLSSDLMQYAAADVEVLIPLVVKLPTLLNEEEIAMLSQESVKRASRSIKDQGKRRMFINQNHQLTHFKPEKYSEYISDAKSSDEQLKEFNSILQLSPEAYRDQSDLFHRYGEMVDFIFDRGTRPYVLFRNQERLALPQTFECSEDPIEYIVNHLRLRGADVDGSMQHNNRMGLEGQLHRISFIRNRSDHVYGITLRIGRAVYGQANTIVDLLASKSKPSILVVGPPGSGKTTLIREMTRIISEFSHVCVVDTSNEIGGDGDTPHKCIGRARRMMVKRLSDQANVMIECVQNHTISTMVIDEIGRRSEVEAANTIKQRGVQVIASAHGSFDQLILNRELNRLLGGIETVTLGDEAAKRTVDKAKVQQQRIVDPVFDIVIELEHTSSERIKIITNVAQAMDQKLKKQPYCAQYRQPGKRPGEIKVELTKF